MKAKLLLLCILFSYSSFQAFAQNVISGTDTNVSQCAGNFYDNGGPNGGYSDNGTEVVSICSDDPALVTKVEFTAFMLAAGDVFNIYDGDSTGAPLQGTYTNGNNPGTVSASGNNTSGCLTFEFVTDGNFSPLAGWQAEISCMEPCEPIDIEIVSVTPSTQTGPLAYDVSVNQEIELVGIANSSTIGGNLTYEWDFNSGPNQAGNTANVTFTNVGTQEVTLTVTDEQGCSEEITITLNVEFNPIAVDTTTYTPQELVVDVLIDNPCAQISNVTFSTGITQGNGNQNNGIGYFDNQGGSFPFASGIVLNSEDANSAEGPETGIQENIGGSLNGGWPGDQDLTDLIQAIEGNTTSQSNDATIIEFDFVSFANEMSFNFLFASDEYGGFQCSYSDPFAFFLTDSNGNTTNIALVPGTATPVAVTTVRDDQYNGGCASVNEEFFDTYTGASPTNFSPINYQGYTVPMVAQSAIIPGETYHIKLAISDRNDSAYNSAVFIEAGSFDIGQLDLGEDITQSSVQATCLGQSVTLESGITPIPGVTFEWYFEGNLLPGEAEPNIEIFEEGNYTAVFSYNNNCTSQDSVLVEFLPTPTVTGNEPQDLFECGNITVDQSHDLTANTEVILGTQNPDNFIITYFENLNDADNNQNPIENPDDYLVSGGACETIFVRIEGIVEGNLTSCYEVVGFEACTGELEIDSTLINLESCDDDNDGAGIFDLTENEALALDVLDAADFTVTYYETQAAADLGTPEIPTPTAYENANGNPQEVFVRVENNENANCYATDSFFVESFLIGEVNPVEDLDICDTTGAGVDFDLTSNTALVLGTQDPADFAVTYYTTQAEADAGTPAIADPANYNVANEGSETIFIRIENVNNTECFNTISFEVSLTVVEVGVLDDIEECDADSNGSALFDLTENETNALDGADPADYTVTYYLTQADADVPENEVPFPATYQNVNNNPQEIFVRVENNVNADCYDTSSFMVESFPSGVANEADDLQLCDNGTGGPYEFDLTSNTPLILGAQDPALFDISYYTNEADAETPQNEITNLTNYPATTGVETIYVRINNTNKPECYSLTSFNLIVNEVRIGEVTDKEECDGGNTGFATFDLTDSNLEALDGQSPLDYEVTYYETQAAADAGTPAIADPANYENTSNPQEIFVRVTVDSDASCYLTESFMIEATTSAPIFDPSPLVACDTDNDGFYTLFDLTQKDDEITGGNPDVTVSYHLTQSDADNGVNAVASPYANVVPYNQTIYVRVEDPANGCVLNTTLELEVYDSPLITTPEPLELCDDDDDQQAIFDLTQVEAEVLDGLDPNNYNITYHDDAQEAEDGVDAITNAGGYENVSNPQTIWIRVTDPNTPTGCYNVVELELIVNPLPVAVQPTNLELCDDELSGSDTDELSVFDLTVKEGEITGGDNSINIVWYETPADFQAGIEIPNPTAYTNIIATNQTIVAQLIDEN